MRQGDEIVGTWKMVELESDNSMVSKLSGELCFIIPMSNRAMGFIKNCYKK